jgi:hypothetical protein
MSATENVLQSFDTKPQDSNSITTSTVFSTNDPLTVIIYSLVAAFFILLIFFVIRKIITQPVTLEEAYPYNCSNTILGIANYESYKSIDSHNRKIDDTPCDSIQGWYNHNKEFKKCFHVRHLPEKRKSFCCCADHEKFPCDHLNEGLIESEGCCGVDFYAYREVRKYQRETTSSIKSNPFDESHQTQNLKDEEVVFLENNLNTTGDSEFWGMANEKFSQGIDLTRQSSKRTKR